MSTPLNPSWSCSGLVHMAHRTCCMRAHTRTHTHTQTNNNKMSTPLNPSWSCSGLVHMAHRTCCMRARTRTHTHTNKQQQQNVNTFKSLLELFWIGSHGPQNMLHTYTHTYTPHTCTHTHTHTHTHTQMSTALNPAWSCSGSVHLDQHTHKTFNQRQVEKMHATHAYDDVLSPKILL